MTKIIKRPDGSEEIRLNPKQELFCQNYTDSDMELFGNGTQSYIDAYDPPRKGNWYATARSRASELLTNPNVFERINELLDEQGFNDHNSDKQLLFVMNQHGDLKSKVAAVREYNRLKQRVADKLEIHGEIAFRIDIPGRNRIEDVSPS